MKIAFLEINATTSFGGIQTAVWNLAHESARLGHDVTVIGGEGPIKNPFADSVKTVMAPYTPRERFPTRGFNFAVHKLGERVSFACRAKTRAAVMGGDFDWVLLNKPFDFFWPWLPGMPRKTGFAFLSGGTDFMPFDRRLARRIWVMFGCSAFNAWQLLDHFHRHATVLYNGVDTDSFAPGLDPGDWRPRFGCGPTDVVFGFAGRLVHLKGLQFAIRALAAEPLAGLPVRLCIAGEGPVRPELERLAADLGVSGRVHFVGPLPHAAVASFYNACDAAIIPSMIDEAFGIGLAEAMSCGLPVIGSYLAAIPEVVGNEETCGLLVPPADHLGLAAAMRKLALSAELRIRLGRHARERVERNFTWRRAAHQLTTHLSAIRPKRAADGEPKRATPAAVAAPTHAVTDPLSR